jgi:hypothetical protein
MKSKLYNIAGAVILFIASALVSTNASAQTIDDLLKEVNTRFYCNGEPIHPELLHTFNASLADPPIIMTVDLVAGFHSNMCLQKVTVDGKTVTEELEDAKGNPQGYYEYEYIGKLDNGVHVVRTFYNGGDSVTFTSVLFVSFKIRKTYDKNGDQQPQLLMTLEKFYDIGDRVYAKITLGKNKVTIDKPIWSDKPVEVTFTEGQ